MSHRNLLVGAAIAASMTLVIATLTGEDAAGENGGGGSQAEGPSPEKMQEMMQNWLATTAPGDQHKRLERFVGSWKTKTKMWWAGPKGPATEAEGTSGGRMDAREAVRSRACKRGVPAARRIRWPENGPVRRHRSDRLRQLPKDVCRDLGRHHEHHDTFDARQRGSERQGDHHLRDDGRTDARSHRTHGQVCLPDRRQGHVPSRDPQPARGRRLQGRRDHLQ